MLHIAALFVSGLIAFLCTPLVIRLAKRHGLVDDPRVRAHPAHTHRGVVPRAGGVPPAAAIILTSILFITPNKLMIGILIGVVAIIIMGLADDYFDMSPYTRFFLNILIVTVVISFGLGIPYVSNPFGGVIHIDEPVISVHLFGAHSFLVLANIVAIVWIVAIMNFVNWSKGVDGQLPGFVAIASLVLGALAYKFSAHDISTESVALFSFIIAGAFAGFLPWNFYPQKIMPGYSGGALAGFLLGVLSILSWGKLGTLLLVLAVPITDALYVILRRLRNRKSPFLGDAGHFHHRLLTIGWGRRRIAVFYWCVSLILGTIALFLNGIQKVVILVFVVLALASFIAIANEVKKVHQKT